MKKKRTEIAVAEVEFFLQENSTCSLRKAVQRISLSKTTMWKIIRHDLMIRFYHCTSVQPLTDAHKVQHRKFCQWITWF